MSLHSGAKILVVDDEAALLHSLTAYLADSGFEVYSAENGRAAKDLYDQQHPDLILTDIHMPIMNGLELLNIVSKERGDTAVIVISGAGELNDAIEALRSGAWDFITKPISDLKVLEHAVNKALERKKLIAENKVYEQRIAENLKILEEDQAAGRRVQMSLLPQSKLEIKDYIFDYKIIPSLELSGDFVEYFTISEDLIGVYLADVSGHGASSAFITVLLKSVVARYLALYKINHDETVMVPAQLMQSLSQEIYNAKLSKYLTIIYGVININTSEFVYGVGGHYPSPILLHANGAVEYLVGSGYPVGILETAEYAEQKVNLEAGSKLLMFSDGIMELLLPQANLEQKDVALLDIISKAKGDINGILELCGVAKIQQNKAHLDDITILSVTRT